MKAVYFQTLRMIKRQRRMKEFGVMTSMVEMWMVTELNESGVKRTVLRLFQQHHHHHHHHQHLTIIP